MGIYIPKYKKAEFLLFNNWRDTRARSYQFAQVLELMQQNEQKEQLYGYIKLP